MQSDGGQKVSGTGQSNVCGHGCGRMGDDAHRHADPHAHSHAHGGAHDPASDAPLTPAVDSWLQPTVLADGQRRTPIRIRQMDCPTEEALIRGKLAGLHGVTALEFNLMQRVMTVTHGVDARDAIVQAVRSLGFTPELADDPRSAAAAAPAAPASWRPLLLAGALALSAELAHALQGPTWLAAGLALVAIAVCGLGTYKKGWIAIRHLTLNINALMSIAVTGAALLGNWPEAAMVMVLFTLAERIEARSLDRARNAIQSLLALTPEKATVRRPDGGWLDIDAVAVPVGATVRVKPGERIALDGRIVDGESTVNQAPITGESLPVDKRAGDLVYAGTINETGSFEFVVSAAASDSTLAHIIAAVEQAQGARAPTQRFVDRFASIYTPVVFAIAILVAVVPPLWLGGGWWEWAYRALVLLVIACPCALVIATPVTVVSGLTTAARQGILIKGGVHLENGRRLRWLALDKTGTVTEGKPVLTDVQALAAESAFEPEPGSSSEASAATPTKERAIAYRLAKRSDHPVSRAIATGLAGQAGADAVSDIDAVAEIDGFTAVAGRGVHGLVDGQRWSMGNRAWMHELGVATPAVSARVVALEEQGRSVVCLADAQRVRLVLAVADAVRESSHEAITALHGLGVRTLMLSGDNARVVARVAADVGIDAAYGEMLPTQKRQAIADCPRDGGLIGMVGDGINDAPALARADIGFAMGAAGSGTAIETADVALMDDDLRKLPRFIALSQRTHRVLWQNIAIALGIKAVFFALTLSGGGTMWMAVFADMGASLIVVANGLRLLRSADKA